MYLLCLKALIILEYFAIGFVLNETICGTVFSFQYTVFYIVACPFVLFLLAIVLNYGFSFHLWYLQPLHGEWAMLWCKNSNKAQ
jgi:hypothetical protein